jgi:hypothetical protein
METLGDNSVTKNEQNEQTIYECKICDFKCSRMYNLNRHFTTNKHIVLLNGDALASKKEQKEQQHTNYTCDNCNKNYVSRNGLWKHKKTCDNKEEKTINNEVIIKDEPTDKDLIMMLIKQNTELMEMFKNGTTNNSHNTTHTNSHNKAFNLNLFLNETCKNAMNISDFVDSIKLQLSDLMDVGELGYVDGISKIIVSNLNNLDETIRPIHCTDKKRETYYIKDQDKWEKEDDNKTKLKRVVNTIANKNIRLLPQFREKYPEYKNSSAKISDTYDKLVIEVMTTDMDKDDKIIRNISKATVINEKK